MDSVKVLQQLDVPGCKMKVWGQIFIQMCHALVSLSIVFLKVNLDMKSNTICQRTD